MKKGGGGRMVMVKIIIICVKPSARVLPESQVLVDR